MANGTGRVDTSQHHADGRPLRTCIEDVLTRPDTRRSWTVRLITRRSQVQILPPLRRKPLAFLHVPRVFSRLESTQRTFGLHLVRVGFQKWLYAVAPWPREKAASSASDTFDRSSGYRCPYRSIVIAMDFCPRCSCTTFAWQPWAMSIDAAVCRRS
jgi:hypothetical protein